MGKVDRPKHTRGPVTWAENYYGLYGFRGIAVLLGKDGGGEDPATVEVLPGDGRLLAAAYNAFDSAARKLGCNAVELAEAMQDGALLAEVLGNADLILCHTPNPDRAAFDKATAILVNAKGRAS